MVFIFKCGILKMVWEIEEENCLWAGDDRDRGNEHPMVCDPAAPSVDIPVLCAGLGTSKPGQAAPRTSDCAPLPPGGVPWLPTA